ncbi:MAG: hypothetical protein ACFFCE_14275 [Promethearchaeota archaeon]
MTKKKDFKKEKEKINQIYDKKDKNPLDSYIRLYSQVVREVSQNLRQKINISNIYITEKEDIDKISSDKNIHHYFKKMQNSSKI